MQVVRSTLSSTLPNNNGTHIITSVSKGIDFILVLEMNDKKNYNEMNSILEKLCKYFIEPHSSFLSTEDQQTINILKLNIFIQNAKLRSFAKTNNLSDGCQNTEGYILGNRNSIPLSYVLHPVKCIYYGD
ncbi:unnamed protein product [Adineta steineri]|uniref:Uncharacterized protein n=1 Tax=Adineta steineri TaxID=433720 RepID=A0A815DC09_9BILA|nr:unnamed protein product [Adineta steineri]CAF4178698.1 unnamed protein product [Adineta steineri]